MFFQNCKWEIIHLDTRLTQMTEILNHVKKNLKKKQKITYVKPGTCTGKNVLFKTS